MTGLLMVRVFNISFEKKTGGCKLINNYIYKCVSKTLLRWFKDSN